MRNRRWAGDGRRHAATGARGGNHAHAGDGLGRGGTERRLSCERYCVRHGLSARGRASRASECSRGSGVGSGIACVTHDGADGAEHEKLQCNQQRNFFGPSRAPHAPVPAAAAAARPPPASRRAGPRAAR